MKHAVLTLAACAASLVAFAIAAPAVHGANAVLDDCASSPTGLLQGEYSRAQLIQALKALGGDLAEYSGCSDAITKALQKLGIDRSPRADAAAANDSDPDSAAQPTPAITPAPGDADSGSDPPLDRRPPQPITPPSTAPALRTPPLGSSTPVLLTDGAVTPGFDTGGRTLPPSLQIMLGMLALIALIASTTAARAWRRATRQPSP